MLKPTRIKHEFVEFIPDRLQPETLYISIAYATAAHKCLCGCGNDVITPITPTDWSLIFNGETVSLDPSIGNWSFACQSHYWIRNNTVQWANQWSRVEIEAGRARDRLVKEKRYGEAAPRPATVEPIQTPRVSFFDWVKGLWRNSAR